MHAKEKKKAKKEKMYPTYVSKHNSNLEMILPREKMHYFAVKNIGTIKRITWKNNGDFYYLDCLHSFRTKSKLESHRKVCENKDFCNVIILCKGTKILELINIKNLI